MSSKEILCRSGRPKIYYLQEEENGLFLHTVTREAPAERIFSCYVVDSPEEDGKTSSWRVSSAAVFCAKVGEAASCRGGQSYGAALLLTGDEELRIDAYENVPHCNILGETMCLDIPNGAEFEEAVFQFYWRTLIPSVIERTKAAAYPVRDGYVLSTLQEEVYAGTYPDVDHEFQIKGRIGMMGRFDLDVVRRMLELQLKLMREDPEHKWRNPCSLQPGGEREYEVRRSSMDGAANAEMFLLTGNIEIVTSVWLYLAASKDWDWLKQHKEELEQVLSLVEDSMDGQGRLWSDVYYEDQVIKDGSVCAAAAFAAQAMKVMADLERIAGDREKERKYRGLSETLAQTLVREFPAGFWDGTNERFLDWIDRTGTGHDHIHLLANELPLLFGFAAPEQQAAVERLIEENLGEFQRFPSFVAARIQDYTQSEIGDGGPYDLCAAGRYWCWDFAYWAWKKQPRILEEQLLKVCRQAKLDDYLMGERYDMNHVYYVGGKNWHGAERYYEYPCVFLWNLLHVYLGVRPDMECDLRLEPALRKNGRVRLDGENQKVEYTIQDGQLSVRNLADRARTFAVCWKDVEQVLRLAPGETAAV